MKKNYFTLSIAVTGLLLAGAAGLVSAETNESETQPLALRTIMKDLGRNMQVVTDAISREDWQRVEITAPVIAKHPQPPRSEKMRILAFIGTDMARFKRHDEQTHDAAQALGRAAKDKDGTAVIAAFHQLQTTCYDCHRRFRQPFVERFYGGR